MKLMTARMRIDSSFYCEYRSFSGVRVIVNSLAEGIRDFNSFQAQVIPLFEFGLEHITLFLLIKQYQYYCESSGQLFRISIGSRLNVSV